MLLIAEAGAGLPEIELFTVLSLVIALTGAVYYVILAIRDERKESIDTIIKAAPNLLLDIKRIHRSIGKNYKNAILYHKKIIKLQATWKRSLRFPIWCFCLVILVIAAIVLWVDNPDNLTTKWLIFRILIGVILVVDAVSLLLAEWAYLRIKKFEGELQSSYQIAQDQDKLEKSLSETPRHALRPKLEPQQSNSAVSQVQTTARLRQKMQDIIAKTKKSDSAVPQDQESTTT